ncbi:MAG: hypothetical protein ACK5QN_10455 [Burkholderiales bacterium]
MSTRSVGATVLAGVGRLYQSWRQVDLETACPLILSGICLALLESDIASHDAAAMANSTQAHLS